ncbi:MAG: chloride channel protein [Phycisphaeraceae bacterium]|nr:chloride channel protein [Phycisphaeraceae bacterium]
MARTRLAPSLARLRERIVGEIHPQWRLIGAGAAVGTVGGCAAALFAMALHGADDLVRLAERHILSWWLLALPVVGALLTGVIIRVLADDARGHGVPQVMEALDRKRGHIPLRVGFAKFIASICTVGSGGSGGAEGPIVQIGASAGSFVSRVLRTGPESTPVLVGCGSAAGMAAIFNAPIAAVLFVLEVLLRDFSTRTLAPILVASVFGTAVAQAILGSGEALFALSGGSSGYTFSLLELPAYVLLGAICGVVSVALQRTLHTVEDLSARTPAPRILKPAIGAVLLFGLGAAYLFVAGLLGVRTEGMKSGVLASGEPWPEFYGSGYGAIRWLIDPAHFAGSSGEPGLGLLILAILGLKMLATSLTLGFGGSGGVFAPALFVGACTGATIGLGLEQLGLLPAGGSPAAYALIGMGAAVAGTMHAPLTAILMLFELTRDPFVFLPIMLAAITSMLVAERMEKHSIYTSALVRKGIAWEVNPLNRALRALRVSDVRLVPVPTERAALRASDPLTAVVERLSASDAADLIVVDADGRFAGILASNDLRTALIESEALPLLVASEVMRTDLPMVTPHETLDVVLRHMTRLDTSVLPVVEDTSSRRPLGLISRAAVMRAYLESLDRQSV